MKKFFCFTAITIAWLALVLVPAIGQAQTLSVTGSCGDVLVVIDSFNAPWLGVDGEDGIHGIATEEEDLLYITRRDIQDPSTPPVNSNPDMLYKIDLSGGVLNVIASYALPTPQDPTHGGSITGLAMVKDDLWFTNDRDWNICKLNFRDSPPTASDCFDINDVKDAAGCRDSTGLDFCAGHWINAAFNWDVPDESCIFKIKVKEKHDELMVKRVKTALAPGTGPEGINCNSGSIWHVDISWDTNVGNKIYRINPKINVICEWDFTGTLNGFLGVTFDGTHYWVNDQTTLYKMQLVPAP